VDFNTILLSSFGKLIECDVLALIFNMAEFQHLPLYYKLFGLIKYLNGIIRNFPKAYKYSFGQDILRLSWSCIDLLVEANALSKNEKYSKILRLSITFDCFKIRLRMAQEIGLISKRQYVHIQSFYVKEIGEMTGGWLKWSRANFEG